MEKEPKVKIFVTHFNKPDYIYEDDVFVPIQAGKKNAKIDLGIQGDDTGDNISEKNPQYAELTTQYWVWKNYDLSDVDYVGFCSYRRYMTYCFKPNFFSYFFKNNPYSGTEKENYLWRIHAYNEGYHLTDFNNSVLEINSRNLSNFINYNYEIYLPKREIYFTGKLLSLLGIPINLSYKFWLRTCCKDEGMTALQKESLKIFFGLYPDYIGLLFDIIDEGKKNIYMSHRHTFIMKKKLYFDYMKWLFDYLFALESYINLNKINTYSYFNDKRFVGIISEILINRWVLYNHKNLKNINYMSNILVLQ